MRAPPSNAGKSEIKLLMLSGCAQATINRVRVRVNTYHFGWGVGNDIWLKSFAFRFIRSFFLANDGYCCVVDKRIFSTRLFHVLSFVQFVPLKRLLPFSVEDSSHLIVSIRQHNNHMQVMCVHLQKQKQKQKYTLWCSFRLLYVMERNV